MLDVTKEKKEKKPFAWKEFAINILIANIPASVLIVLTKELMGITGATVPLLFIFGGGMIVGRIRKKKGSVATWKTILWALAANIVFIVILPIILLLSFS